MASKRLEEIAEKLHTIDKTLERNTALLGEHIRRTENLEERVKPLERSSYMLAGAIAVIGAALALLAKML
jgi:hypothetical protein